MIFGKKTLFSLLLGLYLSVNMLELARVNFLYTTTLLSFCTCILLPGSLISLILRIKRLSFWENLLFIIGLGIAFLEFGGLLLNILLPLVGVNNPLAFQNLVVGFDVYVLLLFIFAWIRTKPFTIQLSGQPHLTTETGSIKKSSQFVKPGFVDTDYRALENLDTITSIQIPLPKRSRIEKVFYIPPIFFPILATLGAIVINNGGSSALTLILLGAIALYSLLLVLFRDKVAPGLYPYAIFFIGIASLFTTSLRSWYVTGHDVEIEFYVFQLTNSHHIWNMAFYRDPYSACLSITILPTILTNLLLIPDMYVYKVIFQIIFATVPVLVFFIVRKYTTPVLAFLCAFFFISFPTFFNDMAMLNRQEIAFLFFGLVLYMMLLLKLSLPMRRILFSIFALSVIVSHYSTNFVLLALVMFVYIFTFILSRSFVKNTFDWLLAKSHITLKNTFPDNMFLSLPLIVLLLLMTYLWNTLYTNSSNHASSVLSKVVSSVFLNADTRSSDLSKGNPEQQIQAYIKSVSLLEEIINEKKANPDNFYSESIISKYPTYSTEQEKLAPTLLGKWLSSLHLPVFQIQAALRSISAYSMQLFVFIGLLAILFFNKGKTFEKQYLLLCIAALFLLALITVLPALAVEYGALRMFQQFLFVLSLPIVIGLSSVLFFVKEQKRTLFTGIVATIFFLNLTGFISHLTGDYYPQMTLDNSGLYYNAYYVHTSDVLAIVWLSKNNVNDEPVQSNIEGLNKLQTYGNIKALSHNFPPLIHKNDYVYLEVSSNVVVSFESTIYIYHSDKPFLDDNKNLIYSSGKNNIYR